jgi:hypothetical protein
MKATSNSYNIKKGGIFYLIGTGNLFSSTQCCGSGKFFLSRIRIPKFFISDPKFSSHIKDSTVHKKGMKNKSNLFLLLIVSGASLMSKKNERIKIMKKI